MWTFWLSLYPDTSLRNCKIISKVLNSPLVKDSITLKSAELMSGMMYPYISFSGYTQSAMYNEIVSKIPKIYQNTKKNIFFRDDYRNDFKVPSRYFRVGFDEVWTSIKYICNNKDTFFINWNRTGCDPECKTLWNPIFKGLFYFGAPRKDRMSSFKKYLLEDNEYEINVMAMKTDLLQWNRLNKKIRIFKYDSVMQLKNFTATLYIDDEFMKKNDCSISCRFYESINSGIPILFDSETIHEFKNNGIEIDDLWIVSSSKDVASKLKNINKIQKDQVRHFNKYHFFDEFMVDLKKLCKERGIL